jgi:hypothetical protein
MKYSIIFLLLFGLLFGCKDEPEQPAKVKACFESEPNELKGGEFQFTNCSQNAKTYRWDFGDGKTSVEKDPVHFFENGYPQMVTLIASNGDLADTIAKNFEFVTIYKPNIYIQPSHQTDLCVAVSFPMGGNLTESEPAYANGWCVNVKQNGKIDNKYDFLFYECSQPDIFQRKKGWCVAREDLKNFFKTNMKEYNFSAAETKDFTDYWIPLLTESDYYCIYPQTNMTLDRIIQLDFSIKPDNIFRLFYGVIGTNKLKEIEAPAIKPFERKGFYVVEWGVFRE